jgi:hypothetical protein
MFLNYNKNKMTKTKIIGNKTKNSSLDDLARQTALDDKDLIKDILSGKEPIQKHIKKPILPSGANRLNSGGWLVYGAYELGEDVNNVKTVTYQIRAINIKTKQDIYIDTCTDRVCDLKWIHKFGLVDCGDYNSIHKVIDFDGLFCSEELKKNVRDIKSLEWIPDLGLFGCRGSKIYKYLDKNLNSCLDEIYGRRDEGKEIRSINWIQGEGLFDVGLYSGVFRSLDNSARIANKKFAAVTPNSFASEYVPGVGLFIATTNNKIIHLLDLDVWTRVDFEYGKFNYNVRCLNWVENFGLLASNENKIYRVLDKNKKRINREEVFSSDYTITALEYIPNLNISKNE